MWEIISRKQRTFLLFPEKGIRMILVATNWKAGIDMKYFEFGQENRELMVILHGGGVCYRGALPVAEEMVKSYRVVLVAYDGFNPDGPERGIP